MEQTLEMIHLRQSSMEFSDPRKAQIEDARRAIPHAGAADAPDVIGFTEVGALVTQHVVERRCDEAGYSFHHFSSIAIAVHPRHKILEVGRIHVLDAQGGAAGYRPRGIVEVTFRTPQRNVVTAHEAHWITGYRLGPAGDPSRESRHERQTDAMIRRVRHNSKGKRISFFLGDTNVNERRDKGQDREAMHATMRRAGLVSIYDELGKYPPTHGNGTIDVIGHFVKDGRVSPERVKVGDPGNTGQRHSDHRMVDAWYSIRPVRQRG